MIIRYLFPVKTHLLLSEPWPLELGKYELSWRVDHNGLVTKVIVEARTNDLGALSTIRPSNQPGVAADITIGVHAERAEIEALVRTAEGVLALFCNIDIDFDGVETEWEGETDEERSQIKLYSFSRSVIKPDVNAPRTLEYELVARSVAAASSITSYETPLSFLRKAKQDLVSGRYIEAFYNYFLFLKTQFAPGYSNPKQVKEKFGASPEIIAALDQARKEVEADKRRDPTTAVRAAQAWMWEVKTDRLADCLRQGDVLIVPERRAPKDDRHAGGSVTIGGSHCIDAPEIVVATDHKIFARNPVLTHLRAQHHPVSAPVGRWYSVRLAREMPAWDWSVRLGD